MKKSLSNIWNTRLLLFLIISFLTTNYSAAEIQKIEYRSWKDCYEFSNSEIKLIINASSGGRVLVMEKDGVNILWEDSNIDGKTLDDFNEKYFPPDAGRFDIGPGELTSGIHAKPWLGSWHAEIIDSLTLELRCIDEKGLGLELVRRFTLDPENPELKIFQSMKNISNEQKRYWFWNRAFLEIGGVAFSPVNQNSKYPDKWNRYIFGDIDSLASDPTDEGVQIRDSLFILNSLKAENLKYGTDSEEGWMAYHYKNLLFINTFPHYLNETYGEAGKQTNIYFLLNKGERQFIEIEPVSPVFELQPGESGSFEQSWHLLSVSEKKSVKELMPAVNNILK